MAKKAGLQLIISLVDEASSGLQKITGSMKGLAVVGGAAVVASVVAIGKAAWDAGQIYDEAMDTIVTKTGASGDALAALEQDFKAVFSTIPTEAGPAADVIAELNRKVGMTGPALQGASKQLLEMTRLLGGDAANNAALFGRVMGDWGITADQAGLALDKIFVAGQQSGAGIDALMQKVVQFGAPLRNMGFTLDESVALLASFEKEGVNTELVLGSLRIAAGKFAKEGKPLKESLMATFEAIQKNTDASAALALGMEVFGARAGPDMVAAIREGRFSVDDLAAAMAGAEGAIMQTADATADFPEKFQVLRNKVTTLLMPLGDIMVTGLTGALDAIGPAIDTAIGWIKNITGEGTTLSGMWLALQNLARTVWPGLRDAIAGSMQIVGNILVNDVVPALSTLFTWLATNLPPAIQAASDFFNNTLLPALRVVAEFITTQVVPVIVEIINWLATNLPPAIQAASDFFNNTLLPAITAVANFITTQVVPVIVEIINWLATNLPPAIQAASDFFNNTLLPALTVVAEFITTQVVPVIVEIINWLATNLPPAIQAASDFFNNTLLPAITAVANFITTQVVPAIVQINDWLGTKIGPVIGIAAAAFNQVLLPAITLIWDIIVQKLIPEITKLNDWLGKTIIAAIEIAKRAFGELKEKLDPVLNVIKSIVTWISTQLKPTIETFKKFLDGIHLPNPFKGLLDTILSVIDAIGRAIGLLREWLKLGGGNNGGYGAQAAPSSVRLPVYAGNTGVSFSTAAGADRYGSMGNTFTFAFAAPATAYDERRIEAAVERAMLRAGVRADVIRRTR